MCAEQNLPKLKNRLMVKINCEVSFFYCTKNIKILQNSLKNTLELCITNLLNLLYDEAEKTEAAI